MQSGRSVWYNTKHHNRKGGACMATEDKTPAAGRTKGLPGLLFFIPASGIWCGRRSRPSAVRVQTATADEATVLDGAAPEIEQLIMAAGTISFFGTRRVVVLPEIDPAAYSTRTWTSCAVPFPVWKMPWWCWAACLNWNAGKAQNRASGTEADRPVQGDWLHGRIG